MQQSEFNALLKLLSDPDEFISGSARKKLIEEFEEIQEKFTSVIAESEDDFFVKQANGIIREYTFKNVVKEIRQWLKSEKQDLLTGLLIVAKIFEPELDKQEIFNFFDNLRRNLPFKIQNLSPFEQIRALNAILFKEYNFSVKFKHQSLDDYSLWILSDAVRNREASALMMTVIYALAAKKLSIPLKILVNSEIHLLSYYIEDINSDVQRNSLPKKIDYYFFVNAVDKGFIFTKENIKFSLEKHKISSINDFQPVSARNLIVQTVTKLMFIARKKRDTQLLSYLIELQRIFVEG